MSKGTSSALAGATLYEFRMQVRRKAFWVLLILGELTMLSGNDTPWKVPERTLLAEAVGDWTLTAQVILPLIFGLLLAGRLPRDRKTGVDELPDTLPASSGGRLAGKFLGSALATATPIFFFYCIGIVYLLVDRGDWMAVPLGLAAFAAINLPGLLFVGAFSIACTAILWVPLYQFLFTGYWFWGNWLLQGPQSHSTSLSRASRGRCSPLPVTTPPSACSAVPTQSSVARRGKAWRASGCWLPSG